MLTADPDQVDKQPGAADAGAAGPAAAAAPGESRQSTGTTCSNCQQPLAEKKATVCPHCGYYFSLGICIELDETWERLAGVQAGQSAEVKEQPQANLTLDQWLQLVPPWGWKLIGCNAAVLLISIFVRIAVPSGFPRTLWSVTQLFAGAATFLACHSIAYLISIADDASMSMLDVVLKPFKLWKDVVRALPQRFFVVASGSCGVTAVFGSLVIIGALDYKVLLDWNIKAPPQRSLMGAIAQAAGEDADRGDGTAGASAADKLAGKTVEKNVRVDCVIVGYTVDSKNPNVISSLLIAREYNGGLKYVGSLSAGLSETARVGLLENLAEIPRDAPIVSVPPHITAKWVQPESFCRVKCVRETAIGSLVEMEFDDLLGAVD